MTVSPLVSRRLLLACALLVAAVALTVGFGVIPPVRGTTLPGITPETAVPAFRVASWLHLLVAAALVPIAMLSKGRSWASTSGLVVAGVAVLLFGFALADAAFAFLEAGSGSGIITVLLFFCVAADALVGALVITTAFLRPKKTRGLTTG